MQANLLKQTWGSVRQQPVLSIVTMAGTALAIFLIMVVVMIQQVKVAPFQPESNRDRFLHASYGSIVSINEGDGWSSNGGISDQSGRALYKDLETAEVVTLYQSFTETSLAVVPGGVPVNVDLQKTDADFWRVLDFHFLAGKPYDTAAFDAGLKEAVVTGSVARALFGTTDAVGRDFLLDYSMYKVVGVVEDVSTLATVAYAQVWIPYTSSPPIIWNDNLMGALSATILVKPDVDFDDVRAEVNRNYEKYNEQIAPTGWRFITRGRPYDQETSALAAQNAGGEPDMKSVRMQRLVIYLILLIVPAINLSSMTDSRMRQRVSEIGVRRAFGCRRGEVALQVISENLIMTLVAGAIGWLLSVVFAYLCAPMLFAIEYSTTLNPPSVNPSMLLQPSTFLWALLFCFVLNLLSSGIPSWRASRTKIVTALNGNKH